MAATAVVLVQATTAGDRMPAAPEAVPWLMAAGAAVLVWRTRVHLLVLLAAGAAVGCAVRFGF